MNNDTATATPAYYCLECFTVDLPSSMFCDRLPREGYRATCLRCCTHNHG